MAAAADRHLLFGLLALQTGIIDQGQLVAAFQAWTLDKMRNLADILVARGDLERRPARPAGGPRRPASPEARRRREEPGRGTGEPFRPRQPGGARRAGDRGHTRTGRPQQERPGHRRRRRRPRPHRQHCRGLGHLRRPAVPHPAAACAGRPGGRLRGARRRIAPRGGLEADPRASTRTTRSAGSGSSPRPRSPAGWSTPASSPSTAWARMPAGRPYYAMRFIKGDSLKEAIARFHEDEALRRPSPAAGRWSCASSCAGSPTSATPSITPTRAG